MLEFVPFYFTLLEFVPFSFTVLEFVPFSFTVLEFVPFFLSRICPDHVFTLLEVAPFCFTLLEFVQSSFTLPECPGFCFHSPWICPIFSHNLSLVRHVIVTGTCFSCAKKRTLPSFTPVFVWTSIRYEAVCYRYVPQVCRKRTLPRFTPVFVCTIIRYEAVLGLPAAFTCPKLSRPCASQLCPNWALLVLRLRQGGPVSDRAGHTLWGMVRNQSL